MIVTKIQFYAIELTRNREGHNDKIRGKFKPIKRKPKEKKSVGVSDNSASGQFSANLTQEVEQELQNLLSLSPL